MNVAFDLKQPETQPLLRRLRVFLGPGRSAIRQTPTILQMEALECGAACLAMILAFYGLWIPLEQLRVACGVSRDGSKAANVLRAARRFGLVAKGFRKEPATLHELPMPCIIHWNFNHFVVLEGLDRGRAYINDPAVGRRRIDVAEFDAAFTGVVLAMVPAAEFKKAGSKPKASRILLRELSGSKQAVALLIAISLALVIPGIAIPAFSKIFVDDILIQHADRWFIPLLIGMAVAAIARALVTACQQSLLLRLETKLTVTMISRFLWHVLALPMEFFTQRHAGDIANRIAINEQIARLLSEGLATNALNLVSLVFFAAVMALYDPLLAAIGVGMSLMNVLAVKLIAQRRRDLSASLTLEHGKLLGSTIGAIRTIETLKASGTRGRFVCLLGRDPGEGVERRTRPGSLLGDAGNVPHAFFQSDHGGNPRRWRSSCDRGGTYPWRLGRIPVTHGEFQRAYHLSCPVGGKRPNDQRRARSAR